MRWHEPKKKAKAKARFDFLTKKNLHKYLVEKNMTVKALAEMMGYSNTKMISSIMKKRKFNLLEERRKYKELSGKI